MPNPNVNIKQVTMNAGQNGSSPSIDMTFYLGGGVQVSGANMNGTAAVQFENSIDGERFVLVPNALGTMNANGSWISAPVDMTNIAHVRVTRTGGTATAGTLTITAIGKSANSVG